MIVRLFRSLLRGRGGPGSSPPVGLFLLAYQLVARIGLSNLPPATLVMMGLQIGIFMRLTDLPWSSLPRSAICLRADAIIAGEYQRLLIAPLEHVSDIHLYYNMVSFAWKGVKLENNSRYGSLGFTGLVSFFAMLTGIVYTVLSYGAAELLDDLSYVQQCSIGFSGILFALKVVANNEESTELREDFGFFTVPLRMAPWAELIIIQLLVPQASFFGHLSGIISGFIFINAVNPFSSVISLTRIIKYPITAIYSVFLYLIHMDLISKPWTSKNFWSSNTPLVCLSVNRILGASKNYSEIWRLISAPLEHSSATHFFICLVSFINKSLYLESCKLQSWKFVSMPALCMLTSSIYITFGNILNYMTQSKIFLSQCVVGLSGPLFAMKVLCFMCLYRNFQSITYNKIIKHLISFLFELCELLILLDQNMLVYNLSGVVAGLAFHTVYCSVFEVRFPGRGVRISNDKENEQEIVDSDSSVKIEEIRRRRLSKFIKFNVSSNNVKLRDSSSTNYSIVLLRHGESKANKEGLWQGWLDSPLTDRGVSQAQFAGQVLKQKGYKFDIAYTSLLSRARVTCNIALEAIEQLREIPVVKTHKLNETHRGNFTGLTGDEVVSKFGIDAIPDDDDLGWKPPKITTENRHYDDIMKMHYNIPVEDIPLTESSNDHLVRTMQYWKTNILPETKKGKRIIIVAHNYTLYCLIRCTDGKIDNKIMEFLEDYGIIPNAKPFKCRFTA